MKKRIWAVLICCTLTMNLSGCEKKEKEEKLNDVQQSAENELPVQSYKVLSEGDHSGVYGTAGEISAYDTVNANYALTVDAENSVHDISDTLFGIFIEDINFADDGGLYA